jgi:hypothetical protein
MEIDQGVGVVFPASLIIDPVPASCVGRRSSSAPADEANPQLRMIDAARAASLIERTSRTSVEKK